MPTWDLENAAHLLRRAAFGGTPEVVQLFHDRHGSVDDAVAELLSFPASGKKPPGPKDVNDENQGKMQRWWLKHMINSKQPSDGCREKLVLFLHNHLASGASKQPTLKYMAIQNGLFRFFAKGNFQTLIREFNRDPANLFYLDGITNVASTDGENVSANENFGRELMELFTLGRSQLAADGSFDPARPNYSDSDVHHMARALTGWTSIVGLKGAFNPGDWDDGRTYDDNSDGLVNAADNKVIFGAVSNNAGIDDSRAGTPDDVLEMIFSRTDSLGNNQVGMFLSKKLWTWYGYPPPAASLETSPGQGLRDLFAGFASTFAQNGFELAPLLTAIWTSDEFYSDRAKSRTVKNPVDYVVQSLRTFGIRSNAKTIADGDRTLGDHCRILGMNLFEPPNVAGWPGSLAWINSSTLLARANFVKELVAAESGRTRIRLDQLDGVLGDAHTPVATAVDRILAQLGLDQGPLALTSQQRDALIDYAGNGNPNDTLDLSDEETDDAKGKLRGVISLALQCAEYQLF